MSNHSEKTNTWQTELINAITQPKELLALLELDMSLLNNASQAAGLFSLKVPRGFINRIKKGDPNDPLLLQILPLGKELNVVSGYHTDPLQEQQANPIPGLLHKYHGRVLLIFTGTCGVNCRYCFRRHFAYESNNPGMQWRAALDYIMQNDTISEVILSGGDPLLANDLTFKNLVLKLADIPHIKRLRIHSRMPIVLPSRITTECIDWMTVSRLKTVLVLHSNHTQEINSEVSEAMHRLKNAGITLLNQAVLLKGINDNAQTLALLSETLFECGILPYYLHLLDKVQGAAHFDTDLETAKRIHWELSQKLPGYLVPKLACEQPNAPAKLLVNGTEFFTV